MDRKISFPASDRVEVSRATSVAILHKWVERIGDVVAVDRVASAEVMPNFAERPIASLQSRPSTLCTTNLYC